MRYDLDGNVQWSTLFGNSSPDFLPNHRVRGLRLDTGQLVVTGAIAKPSISSATYDLVFGPGEEDELMVAVPGYWGFGLMARFEPADGTYVGGSADFVWGTPGSSARECRLDALGNGNADAAGNWAGGGSINAAGSYLFNPGLETELTVTTTGLAGYFAHYLADGSIDWVHLCGEGGGQCSTFGVDAIDGGAAVFSGGFVNPDGDTVLFTDSGEGMEVSASADSTMYVVRYSADGAIDWLDAIQNGPGGTNPRPYAVESDDALFAFLAGHTTTTFNQGLDTELTYTHVGLDQSDQLLARYNLETGAIEWVRAVDAASFSWTTARAIGDELVGTWFVRGLATANPGTEEATSFGTNGWQTAGVGRWGLDGDFRSYRELAGIPGSLGFNQPWIELIPRTE